MVFCRKLVTGPPLSFSVLVRRRPKAPHTVFFKANVAMQRGRLTKGQKLCSEVERKNINEIFSFVYVLLTQNKGKILRSLPIVTHQCQKTHLAFPKATAWPINPLVYYFCQNQKVPREKATKKGAGVPGMVFWFETSEYLNCSTGVSSNSGLIAS